VCHGLYNGFQAGRVLPVGVSVGVSNYWNIHQGPYVAVGASVDRDVAVRPEVSVFLILQHSSAR
jgi:hypothetical protein